MSGLGARGFEQKIMESYAAKKIHAKKMLQEAAEASGLCREWLHEAPH